MEAHLEVRVLASPGGDAGSVQFPGAPVPPPGRTCRRQPCIPRPAPSTDPPWSLTPDPDSPSLHSRPAPSSRARPGPTSPKRDMWPVPPQVQVFELRPACTTSPTLSACLSHAMLSWDHTGCVCGHQVTPAVRGLTWGSTSARGLDPLEAAQAGSSGSPGAVLR